MEDYYRLYEKTRGLFREYPDSVEEEIEAVRKLLHILKGCSKEDCTKLMACVLERLAFLKKRLHWAERAPQDVVLEEAERVLAGVDFLDKLASNVSDKETVEVSEKVVEVAVSVELAVLNILDYELVDHD